MTLDNGEVLKAETVVSNSDCVRTCEELLPKKVADKFMSKRKFEAACSGVVLYLGLRKKYDHILHHNFVFSRDPHVEFGEIYGKGEPAADPTCYVCAPSLSGDKVAPEMAKRCTFWFIRRTCESTTIGTRCFLSIET